MLQEERQLGIGHQTLDPELAPFEVTSVGELAGTRHRGTFQAFLEGCDVVDADGPAQPAASHLGTGPHGLPEGGLRRGGMV